jgi:hypothetical protein
VGAQLLDAVIRKDGRTDRQTVRQTERHDEANSRSSQFVERA